MKSLKNLGLTQEYQFMNRTFFNIGERNDYEGRNSYHIQVNIENLGGGTPLHRACYFGCDEYVKTLLLNKNINVNAKDSLHETPLHKLCHVDFGKSSHYCFDVITNDLIRNPFLRISEQNSKGETVIDKLQNAIEEIQNCNFGWREDCVLMIEAKRECQNVIDILKVKLVENRKNQFLFLKNNLSEWGKTGKDRGVKRKIE
jgi:hypothetical protein